MYCRQCGQENPEGAKFCGRCGASFAATQSGVDTKAGKAETISGGLVIGMIGNAVNVVLSLCWIAALVMALRNPSLDTRQKTIIAILGALVALGTLGWLVQKLQAQRKKRKEK